MAASTARLPLPVHRSSTRVVWSESQASMVPSAFGGSQPGMSPRLKLVTDQAQAEADRLKDEFVSTEHLFVAIADETGLKTELSTTGGTSDGRFIAQICPQVIEFGPPNATIHKVDEHVAVADIAPLKAIYRRTLENLNAGLAA